MLEQGILSAIKQNNVSKDGEKTKQRVKQLWMSLEKSSREEILASADLKKYTIQRTYTNGNISAKLAVVMAQILNISPYYLTGEIDEQQVCTEELLIEFLKDKGYAKLFTPTQGQKRKYNRKDKSDEKLSNGSKKDKDEEIQSSLLIDSEVKDDSENPKIVNIPPQPESTSKDLPYVKLLAVAKDCIGGLSEDEKSNLEKMNEEEINLLIKSLFLRSKYNDDTKVFADFLKLVLTQ